MQILLLYCVIGAKGLWIVKILLVYSEVILWVTARFVDLQCKLITALPVIILLIVNGMLIHKQGLTSALFPTNHDDFTVVCMMFYLVHSFK